MTAGNPATRPPQLPAPGTALRTFFLDAWANLPRGMIKAERLRLSDRGVLRLERKKNWDTSIKVILFVYTTPGAPTRVLHKLSCTRNITIRIDSSIGKQVHVLAFSPTLTHLEHIRSQLTAGKISPLRGLTPECAMIVDIP